MIGTPSLGLNRNLPDYANVNEADGIQQYMANRGLGPRAAEILQQDGIQNENFSSGYDGFSEVQQPQTKYGVDTEYKSEVHIASSRG
jgi:hypothetical protein